MLLKDSNRRNLVLALFALYIIWGSTYFFIRIGVASWPPLMLAGIRYSLGGVILLVILLLKGDALPTLKQSLHAGIIGILLLSFGNGLVTVAENLQVPSGIAAVVVASVPLFTLCFGYLWGLRATLLEWTGVVIGLAGIVLLNTGGNLTGHPMGALLLIFASISWAFGSVISARLTLPKGLMAGAMEMIIAGAALLIASALCGEHLTRRPDMAGILALGYLVIFGSIIAVSAYMFLLKYARPALATSYAYVNPVVAVLLGIGFAGERLNPVEWLALGIIIFAVMVVMMGRSLTSRKPSGGKAYPLDQGEDDTGKPTA